MQHQIISSVATQQKRHPKVCFKGGTLLRVCWQQDYRFSEDLDFDWLDEADATKEEILDFFSRALSRAAKQFGGEYEVRWGAHNMRRRKKHDPSFPMTGDWQSSIFDSTAAKMPALEARWNVIVGNGMIPDPAPTFDNIVSTLLDELAGMPDVGIFESGGEPLAPGAGPASPDEILHEVAIDLLPVADPKPPQSQLLREDPR